MQREVESVRTGQPGRLIALFATVQVVWYYLTSVPNAMDLLSYERGTGPMPFQGRMLMMLPLRWAHENALLSDVARTMTAMPGWFAHGCHAEGLVQALTDVLSVLVTGWVARRIYLAASPTGVLGPYIYPLTLIMVAATYSFNAVHPLRFVYDLPSLGLFSLGLEMIFFRRRMLWFASLFALATVNRETSLFLLVMEGLTLAAESRRERGAGLNSRLRWTVVVILLGGWVAWHLEVGRIFAGNPSAAAPRLLLNAGTVLCPISWTQLLSVGAFCGPMLLLGGRRIADATLRAWRWMLPLWLAFMVVYGLLIETRVFGELIAFAASSVALLAEQEMLTWLEKIRRGAVTVDRNLPLAQDSALRRAPYRELSN